MTAEFVAFDLETTGLSPDHDRIVEVGAIRFDASGRELDLFERLVNPLRPSGAVARSIHGIPDEELAGAETAAIVLPAFVDFLGDPSRTTLLAHNAAFDAGFLGRELVRIGLPMPGHAVVDTLALSRLRWPKLGTHKLDSLAQRLDLDPHGPHRALADARRVLGLWLALEKGAEPGESPLAYPIFDAIGPLPAPRAGTRWRRPSAAMACSGWNMPAGPGGWPLATSALVDSRTGGASPTWSPSATSTTSRRNSGSTASAVTR